MGVKKIGYLKLALPILAVTLYSFISISFFQGTKPLVYLFHRIVLTVLNIKWHIQFKRFS